ncbi:MAG: DnaJ domain-containing protein, partial [Acidobacteriota bacterium]
MRTYYQLLSVADSVPADDIKRAFRREIARYHPDKVQHLGTEFQEIAAVRASDLTEAYRVLMDPDARRAYDQSLQPGVEPASSPASTSTQPASPAPDDPARPGAVADPEPAVPRPDGRFEKERATTGQFVRRATLSRVREAVAAVAGTAAPVAGTEFDIAFDINGKGGFFRVANPPLRLLAQFVGVTDAAAVESHWVPALKARNGADPV